MRIVINSDAHGPNTLDHTRWGVATARRAWLTKDDVANTLPWEEFAALRKRAALSARVQARAVRAAGAAAARSRTTASTASRR